MRATRGADSVLPNGLLGILLPAIALLACGPEIDDGSIVTSDKIVGGTNDSGHPAVASLDLKIEGAAGIVSGTTSCTGTLISSTVIVSAAHCVKPRDPSWGPLTVVSGTAYFGSDAKTAAVAERKTIKSWHAHPSYAGNVAEDPYDIGVFVLAEPSSISPMAWNRQALAASDVGQAVTSVGFGRTSGGAADSVGVKRVVTTSLVALRSNGKQLDYGAAGATTCQGDSGGPELMSRGDVETVVGVTSFGPNPCESGAATAVRTDAFASFLDQYLGSGGGSGGGGTGGGTGGGGGSGASTCCINGRCYTCPTQAAVDRCLGFDLNACVAGCGGDYSCYLSCQSRAAAAPRDPSGCTPL